MKFFSISDLKIAFELFQQSPSKGRYKDTPYTRE